MLTLVLGTDWVANTRQVLQMVGEDVALEDVLRQVLEESGQLREDMLDAFGIERAWLDRFPRELSGGELQRFCVARALMSGADFLICDEISTMLDVITQAQIWEVVLAEAARRDMGLIAVTHNRHLADRICTRGLDLRSLGASEGL